MSCPDCVEIFVYEEREVILVLELENHKVVVSAANKSPHNLVFVALQRHEQQCPFASVMCPYCDMELIRDQVSEMRSATLGRAKYIVADFNFFQCKLNK